jgi:integrase
VTHRLQLPFADWPEHDRNSLLAAFAKEGRFHRGQASHWAVSTQHAVVAAIGRWLGFLLEFEPFALIEHPLERLTEDSLTRYIDHLSETVSSVGRFVYLEHLRRGYRAIYQKSVPEILDAVVAQLRREYRPQPKEWVTTPRLTELGINLMNGAVRKDGQVRKIAFRDGMMIMLLARRPIRRRAFAVMRIGTHLRQVGEEWRLIFRESETKSGRPFETAVPRKVVPFLARYLSEVRPMFRGTDGSDALWFNSKGYPLSVGAITNQIAHRTLAAFGHQITPHRFRHSAASTIAVLEPSEIAIAPGLLDQASLATTHAHYILSQSIEASRLYARVLAEVMPRRSRKSIRQD